MNSDFSYSTAKDGFTVIYANTPEAEREYNRIFAGAGGMRLAPWEFEQFRQKARAAGYSVRKHKRTNPEMTTDELLKALEDDDQSTINLTEAALPSQETTMPIMPPIQEYSALRTEDLSRTTVLAESEGWKLVHHSRGYEPAGSMARYTEERWSASFYDSGSNETHGRSFRKLCDAQRFFEDSVAHARLRLAAQSFGEFHGTSIQDNRTRGERT